MQIRQYHMQEKEDVIVGMYIVTFLEIILIVTVLVVPAVNLVWHL